MYTIQTRNKIAPTGLEQLPAAHFKIDDATPAPDAVLVRSAHISIEDLPSDLLAVARAGAGVNNIPVDECSARGIVVFNTPGANANAVKELAVCSLFLASRDIVGGIEWARSLEGDISGQVEKGKSSFAGPEIAGKTLGVVGLGAIGVEVANNAHNLDMNVLGYDPYISVETAWGLSRDVVHVRDIADLFAAADYISLHVPLTPETRESLAPLIDTVKPGVRIINLARGGLIDSEALVAALDSGKVARYVTDFPDDKILSHPKVIPLPHLGASTPESEENCSIMAASELREYILYGNIKNSVNFPNVDLPKVPGYRLSVIHENIPNILTQITSTKGLNIEHMNSQSKKHLAYTLLAFLDEPNPDVVAKLRATEGILRVRSFAV